MFTMEPTKVYASTLTDVLLGDAENRISNTTGVGGFIDTLIGFAIPLAVLSVFVLLVFASYQLITSQGNPDKLKEGKEVITNAIIGFIFVILSVAILLLLSEIFGINIQ